MFFYLYITFVENFSFLNLFKYITFRAGGALFTSLLICFILGPIIIKKLKTFQKAGQPIRKDGPKSHIINKAGTPTMGGILILISMVVSTILWSNLDNILIWCVLLITISFGILGGLDDYYKIKNISSDGINSKFRLIIEFLLAFLFIYFLFKFSNYTHYALLHIPYFKDLSVNLGNYYFLIGMLVIVGCANAVNLTDGLDGLAIGPVIISCLSFAFIAYFSGNFIYAHYLKIPFIPGTGELVIICAALIGSGLGFLWYNAPPAMVFMGDTGSLSVGGTIGAIAVITKHELILVIIGGLFVLETISVIIQVISFKTTGKRIFKMAPLHHHFEQKGWSEPTIVIRFWIISIILALIGLASLKLR